MKPRIAIVGSGPSGVYLLQQLLAQSRQSLDITVFESGGRAGIGSPYDAALNGPSMLANIACIEIPVVEESLTYWLRKQTAAELARLDLNHSEIDRREFYPRVVLGEYYAAQFNRMVGRARYDGHDINVRTGALVADVAAHPHSASLSWRNKLGALQDASFDYIVVANGHRARGTWAPHGTDRANLIAPSAQLASLANARIGVLGTSLSAIDVAVSAAEQFGTFVDAGDGLTYQPNDSASEFHLTLMSRRGYLPEADFYCPIPYEPLDICHAEAVDQACSGPIDGRLERLFALFSRQLTANDPDYARRIGLDQCTPDTFGGAYFAERAELGPIEFAATNLSEARANAAAQRTVAWRYAILRMHKHLGDAVAKLSPNEAERFRKGLGAMFIDNYAAVPHLSLDRVLALHRAGRLDIATLGFNYAMNSEPDGRTTVVTGNQSLSFNHLIDARGQAPLTADELPFPTLRFQILANSLGETPGAGRRDIAVAADYALADGINRLSRVFCLSVPHLLRRHPFIQGLTSCHELGVHVAGAILSAAQDPNRDHDPFALADLIALMDRTSVVEMPGGSVVLQVPLTEHQPPLPNAVDAKPPFQPVTGKALLARAAKAAKSA